MKVGRRAVVGLLCVVAVGGMALSFGCGNTIEQDPTPLTTQPITPAAPRTVVAEPTEAATATTDETPSGDGMTLTLVAKNIKFDVKELAAPAGEITFVVDNLDTGVPHNVHIYKGENAKGESQGKSDLKNGPSKDELKLTLEAGEYFFICDAHPNMKGPLTVS